MKAVMMLNEKKTPETMVKANKPGTAKVGAIPKLKKRKLFENMLRTFFKKKNSQRSSKHPKGAFSARKTLQKFGYSVLRQM